MRITGVAASLAGAVIALCSFSASADAISVSRFGTGIGAGSEPWGITAGADGNLWFTEPGRNRVGRITPAGAVTEFASGITAGSQPTGITAGSDGNLWFTEPGIDRVARITPAGNVQEFSAGITPGSAPSEITNGPDGNLWFTEPGGDRIARITPGGVVTEFPIGASIGEAPDDITAGPDGNLWFTEPDLNRVGRITPQGAVSEFATGSGPTGITTGPDGNLWVTQAGAQRLARVSPSGTVTQGALLGSAADPRRIAAGRDGNLWITDAGSNRLLRTTLAGVTNSFGALNAPERITPGPDGNLWFTEPFADRVSRVRFEAPGLFNVRAIGETKTSITLTGQIDPQSEPTSYVFEVGRTPSYTFASAARSAGSGSSRTTVAVEVTRLSPGATYHFRLRATNSSGASTGRDHTFQTAPELDRDRDGVNVPGDCDDNNPRIHPGAVDIPQNGVDEDCVDRDADYRRLDSTIRATFKGAGSYTKFKSLKILRARAGSTIRLRCRGRGCHLGKRARTIKVNRFRASLKLTRRVRRVRLYRKTQVTVRVTRPRTIGLLTRWRGRGPRITECSLRPNVKRPQSCHRP